MVATRTFFLRVCPLLTLAACGGPQGGAQGASSDTEVSCPAPIGTIARENCSDIAEDFGALNVDGALKLASSSKGAEERIEAIKAAGDLAVRLKERRVEVCGQYNSCKMTLADHNTEDERLAALMASLIKFWNERKFLDPDGAAQLRSQVASLSAKLDGQADGGDIGTSTAQASSPIRVLGDKLPRGDSSDGTFSTSAGAVTISTTKSGEWNAFRLQPSDLGIAAIGDKYLVRVIGSYTPSEALLIKPGDELTVKLKCRASADVDVTVALRSIEDPDSTEGAQTFVAKKGTVVEQQFNFTADPASSGHYVSLRSQAGSADGNVVVEFDEVDVLRGKDVIASARGEGASEPYVGATSCKEKVAKPIAGKGSYGCRPAPTDAITIGKPAGHLFMGIGTSGLATASLKGGRTVDGRIDSSSVFTIRLVGPGKATIEALEITKP